MPPGTSIPTDAEVASADANAPIEDDVPCIACGYNLRGLLSNGRCPECALDIVLSLFEHAHRARTIGPPLSAGGRQWLVHLTEGAALVQIVLFLMLAITFAPDWAWASRSRPREVLLGIACTIWVLAWLGVWKIGRPEPGAPAARSWWLRGCATLYLAVPFTVPLLPHDEGPAIIWIAMLLAMMIAGAAASVLYYRVIGGLGWRAGSGWFHVHATFPVFLGAMYLLAALLLPSGHGSPDSLSMMLDLPTIQMGSGEHVRTMIWSWGWHPLELVAALFPVWATVLNFWLLVLLIRSRMNGRVTRPAASDGNTATSSRP